MTNNVKHQLVCKFGHMEPMYTYSWPMATPVLWRSSISAWNIWQSPFAWSNSITCLCEFTLDHFENNKSNNSNNNQINVSIMKYDLSHGTQKRCSFPIFDDYTNNLNCFNGMKIAILFFHLHFFFVSACE